jgi:hypothetical protein
MLPAQPRFRAQAPHRSQKARPFATESYALDSQLYLCIALELYLKPCLVTQSVPVRHSQCAQRGRNPRALCRTRPRSGLPFAGLRGG